MALNCHLTKNSPNHMHSSFTYGGNGLQIVDMHPLSPRFFSPLPLIRHLTRVIISSYFGAPGLREGFMRFLGGVRRVFVVA